MSVEKLNNKLNNKHVFNSLYNNKTCYQIYLFQFPIN